MSVAIFGMYKDRNKETKVVSGHRMQTSFRRRDWEKKGHDRSVRGELTAWRIAVRKYEVRLTLRNVREGDLESIESAFDKNNTVFFFPDEENDPDRFYEVMMTNEWDPVKDKFTGRYSLSLELKEV